MAGGPRKYPGPIVTRRTEMEVFLTTNDGLDVTNDEMCNSTRAGGKYWCGDCMDTSLTTLF